MLNPLRWLLRLHLALRVLFVGSFLAILYLGVTFVEVWQASRRDQVRPVQAIVVLGAAHYDGRPSPVFRSRLDHAADLYHEGIAPVVVVTGGTASGDRISEASAGARYLTRDREVPDDHILRETTGRNSWESLAASARFLRDRGISEVVLVSDPFHAHRIDAIADEVGLVGYPSPTRTSPIGGAESWRRMGIETVKVAVGRIIGFRRLVNLTASAAPVAPR